MTCHKWGWSERRNSVDVSFLTIAGDILWVILEIRRVGLHCLCSNCSVAQNSEIYFWWGRADREVTSSNKRGWRWNKSVCLLNTSRRIFREFLIIFWGGGVACLRHGVTDTLTSLTLSHNTHRPHLSPQWRTHMRTNKQKRTPVVTSWRGVMSNCLENAV